MKNLLIVFLFFPGCNRQAANKSSGFPIQKTGQPSSIISKKLILSTIGQHIIHLKAGPQPGVNASGKSNITYLADQGLVIFTSQIILGKTLHIKFDGPDGFKFTGTDYSVFKSGGGNNIGDTIRNFDFGNTAKTVFDAITKIYTTRDTMLTYNGKPETTVFWGLTVDSFKVSGKTSLYQGPWESNDTYHMVTVGATFTNGLFVNDGTGENQKIRGNSIYGLKVENWKITGPTLSKGGDYGIVFIVGTGYIKNVYRNGGWGYLERIVIVTLGGIPFDQNCGISNCVDVNSTQYGTVDVRIEPGWLKSKAVIPLTGGDFYFVNNISGNKKDYGSYVTNAVVLGSMKDDLGKKWVLHLNNNIAFNAMVSPMSNESSLLKNNSNGLSIIDSSNNIDLPPGKKVPVDLVDSNLIIPN
jgi:hypothetical protein